MTSNVRSTTDTDKVICIILGGGGGKGLFPLTRDRATPAVPLAGSYRLVDVPISNCINSGFRQIYVLTQFNSVSLHRHVSEAYKFDQFTDGFVEIRAAQQTFTDSTWYQGTADAVRKNLAHFLNRDFEHALILSADQLYRMDFRTMLAQHTQTGADVTIGTVAVSRAEASHLGILQTDATGRLQRFVEKPSDPTLLESLKLPGAASSCPEEAGKGEKFLASMGIYVFTRGALEVLLNKAQPDFGRDIIPEAVHSYRVFSFLFEGYWSDIGTIGRFFEANLALASELPRFNFFDLSAPIFSQPLYLPGAKINGAEVEHALFGAGCIINHARVRQSILGLRSFVDAGADLYRVVSLGCDYYESQESIVAHAELGLPRIGVGHHSKITNTIIDRNARIGDNVSIDPAGKPSHVDHEHYFIRDGVVIVPRNGVIPHGAVI